MAMPEQVRQRTGRIRPEVVLLVTLAALWLAAVGTLRWSPPPPDEWERLVEIGDTLARVGGTMDAGPTGPRGLTARTAYLLAFHHAQDASNVPRMVETVERLEDAGEVELAATLRRAAGTAQAEIATRR